MSMQESFSKYLTDHPGIQLIPKEDVAKIKIKLGKSHRKESDWQEIKNILCSYDLITATPLNSTDSVRDVSDVLFEDNKLIAFTNFDDCEKHLRRLYEVDKRIGEVFKIRSLAFADLIEIAESQGVNIFIDVQDEKECMCIVYIQENRQIIAARLIR